MRVHVLPLTSRKSPTLTPCYRRLSLENQQLREKVEILEYLLAASEASDTTHASASAPSSELAVRTNALLGSRARVEVVACVRMQVVVEVVVRRCSDSRRSHHPAALPPYCP